MAAKIAAFPWSFIIRPASIGIAGFRGYLPSMLKSIILLIRAIASAFRSQQMLALENLLLRQQLIVLQRKHKRPRFQTSDRVLIAWISIIYPQWKEALLIVKPETVIRWHKLGFKLFWRWKSRLRNAGKNKIDPEIRNLIRSMSQANPLWGAPRIHRELLKLGIEVSQATVRRYMVKGRGRPSQTWRTFLNNHIKDIASIDFFVVPTVTIKLLFALVVLSHDRRKIVHFNVTSSPTAFWTGQQVIEAFPWDTAPKYLLRDNDSIYGAEFTKRVNATGIKQVRTSFRSPWQNAYCERVIGSIRRECTDHFIVLNEAHLRRILRQYVDEYYNGLANASISGQSLSRATPGRTSEWGRGSRDAGSRRSASSLQSESRIT